MNTQHGDPASPPDLTAEIAIRAVQDVVALWTENRRLRDRIAALEAQLAERSAGA